MSVTVAQISTAGVLVGSVYTASWFNTRVIPSARFHFSRGLTDRIVITNTSPAVLSCLFDGSIRTLTIGAKSKTDPVDVAGWGYLDNMVTMTVTAIDGSSAANLILVDYFYPWEISFSSHS